ncbi:DUF1705 domain-containing protein [Siminovitchia acidinfaciens]|uniref:DUF1705 domain-containing protein n=1 Tax=Siminovitchia acidinfaciens TaxID=2321395 RepID=A0A429Y801_9BACI|nr:DUF1705 domain-containing protein [Siminovitchia acidinfaciens]
MRNILITAVLIAANVIVSTSQLIKIHRQNSHLFYHITPTEHIIRLFKVMS